jgi:hypothetical protein
MYTDITTAKTIIIEEPFMDDLYGALILTIDDVDYELDEPDYEKICKAINGNDMCTQLALTVDGAVLNRFKTLDYTSLVNLEIFHINRPTREILERLPTSIKTLSFDFLDVDDYLFIKAKFTKLETIELVSFIGIPKDLNLDIVKMDCPQYFTQDGKTSGKFNNSTLGNALDLML